MKSIVNTPILLKFLNLEKIEGEVLDGIAEILGVRFKVQAVQVQEEGSYLHESYPAGEMEHDTTVQMPVRDPQGILFRLQQFDGDESSGTYHTVKLPGFEGDWVLIITPCDR